MKLIVSCFISLTLLFNLSFANITLPDANNLFRQSTTDNFVTQSTTDFVTLIDENMGGGLNAILLLVYKIGIAIAIIATVVLAMKLMLTNPAKKAEVKAAILPYLIGLLLLIAGVRIAITIIEVYTELF